MGGVLARRDRKGCGEHKCTMNVLFSFTTNVRLVTTLDDLRFMTSLPVVNLTSCRW
jgi:hypothetical protein